MNDKIELFVCECGGHAYQLFYFDGDEDLVSITVWRSAVPRWKFMHRLRHCIYVLRHGYPDDLEDVLLPASEARRFAFKILEFTSPSNKKEAGG